MLSLRNHFNYKDTCRLKVKGWRKIYLANINEKKVGIVTLTSDSRPQSKEAY